MAQELPRFDKRGDLLKRSAGQKASQLTETLQGLSNLTLAPGLELTRTPRGTGINLPENFDFNNLTPGLIVGRGANGEADPTNENYWVKSGYVISNGTNSATAAATVGEFPPFPTNSAAFPCIATNWAEQLDHTHLLCTNGTTTVLMTPMYDADDNLRWVFSLEPQYVVEVNLTGTSGANVYTGTMRSGTGTVNVTATNLAEYSGTSTLEALPLLKVPTTALGLLVGRTGASNNVHIEHTQGVPFPVTLSSPVGSAGGPFQYTATHAYSGVIFGTNITRSDNSVAPYIVAGTRGTGYIDPSGAFKLYGVDEAIGTSLCITP